MMETARPRIRPISVVTPAPSNVVDLRPGIRVQAAPEMPKKARPRTRSKVTKAPDFLTKVTTETGKNANKNNNLLRGTGLTQVRGTDPLSPSRENPTVNDPTFQRLVAKLPATKLRETFPLEANSHRNMMGRAKDGGYTVHPAFHDFRAFLAHVGPRPSEAWTLDRKDPRNPVYGPGLVRWADKRMQANNRADTVMLTMDGLTLPLADWARRTGQERRTLAKRIDRGWSHAEAIRGRRLENEPATPLTRHSNSEPSAPPLNGWPKGATVDYWEPPYKSFSVHYRKRYGHHISRLVVFAWLIGNRIRRLRKRLLDRYSYLDPDVHPDDQGNPSGDPDYAPLLRFEPPYGEALANMTREEHDLYGELTRRFPTIMNPEQLATVRMSRSDDYERGW